MHRIFVDGVEDAGVAADDPGLLLGMTVFETLRTYSGRPFRPNDHLDRLAASASFMGIETQASDVILRTITETLEACQPLDGPVRIRLTVTGGGAHIIDIKSLQPGKAGRPVHVGRLNWAPPEYLPGLIKHGSRAAWVVASKRQEVEEVLLVDPEGDILEGSRSNVFVVKDGVLSTPPTGNNSLPGITRQTLIEVAASCGIPCKIAPVPFHNDYDEFYLSSTLKQLAPVPVRCGKAQPGAGPVGESLLKAFRQLVEQETASPRLASLPIV